jgi:cobalt-zinc-cadmium efflux system protein
MTDRKGYRHSCDHNHDNHNHGSHNHGHSHLPTAPAAGKKAMRGLLIALILNTAFVAVEFVGARVFDSVAILSDAIHDTGDTIVLALSVVMVAVGYYLKNSTFSFGLRRLSILGGTLTVVVLIAGSIYTMIESIGRFHTPHAPQAQGMFALAIFGVVANFAGFWVLRGGGSAMQEVLSLHLLEDVLGWVAVLIGALVMMVFHAPMVDTYLGLGISVFILYGALRQAKRMVTILLEGVPRDVNQSALVSEIRKVEQVLDVHDVHLWTLDGESHLFSCHLVVPGGVTLEEAIRIRELVRGIAKDHGIWHTTIEIDPEGYLCGAEYLHL